LPTKECISLSSIGLASDEASINGANIDVNGGILFG
jgi:hypothetical protein